MKNTRNKKHETHETRVYDLLFYHQNTNGNIKTVPQRRKRKLQYKQTDRNQNYHQNKSLNLNKIKKHRNEKLNFVLKTGFTLNKINLRKKLSMEN